MAKNKAEIAIIVQARLASQRIPEKMIRPFAASTLLDILFEKLGRLKSLPREQVFVSAFDEPIKEIAQKHNFQIFHRCEGSVLEEHYLPLIFEWHNKLPEQFKYVIIVSACNPLLKIETIDEFIDTYAGSDEPGGFGVFEKKTYYWDENKESLTDWQGEPGMNTKFVAPVYEAAHCLYASPLDLIGRGYWMSDSLPPRLELFVMDEMEAFDIDHEWEFQIGEKLYEKFMDPRAR